MKYWFTAEGGADLTAVRAGETPTNPLAFSQLFVENFIASGHRLFLLPGTYAFEETLDLRTIPDVCIYGDGKVFIDGNGELEPAIYLGSSSTVTGIRFKDCLVPVILDDGISDSLVFNCWDYQSLRDLSAGQSFTARAVTDCTLKNLARLRKGRGITALKGTTIRNCLSVNPTGQVAGPAFSGQLLDPFDSKDYWRGILSGGRFVFQMRETGGLGQTSVLALSGVNRSGSQAYLAFYREVPSGDALDLSVGDRLVLVLSQHEASGVVADPAAYRVTIGSPAGTYRFDLADTDVVAGYNVLVLDLTAPTATTGAINLADIRSLQIETLVADDGYITLLLDEAQIRDATLEADFNAAPLFEGADVYADFKGASGIDATASPPPFRGEIVELFQYDKAAATFPIYVVGGYRGMQVGAVFNACHSFTEDVPRHLKFTDHVLLGAWTNDETFFDTITGLPGPEGEGLCLPIDEQGIPVAALNSEVVNLAQTANPLLVRDTDDARAYTFDKDPGVEPEMGTVWDFSGAPIDASAATGFGGDYYIDETDLTNVLAAGLEIVLRSPGGEVSQTLPKTALALGYNTVELAFASPESSSGVFDQSDIQEVELKLHVNAAATLTDHAADHLFLRALPGTSTGPATFGFDGTILPEVGTFPENMVARAISDLIPIKEAKGFIWALVSALESTTFGAVVDRVAALKSSISREIELRYTEFKTGRYGTLQGALARDWFPISKAAPETLQISRGFVQARMTLRNRIIVPPA